MKKTLKIIKNLIKILKIWWNIGENVTKMGKKCKKLRKNDEKVLQNG